MKFCLFYFLVFFTFLFSPNAGYAINKDTLHKNVAFFVQPGITCGKTMPEYWKCSPSNYPLQKKDLKMNFNLDYQFTFFCLIKKKWLLGIGSFSDHFKYTKSYKITFYGNPTYGNYSYTKT